MKKFSLLLLFVSLLFAKIPGISFDDFLKYREKISKPVVLFVYSKTCPYCKYEIKEMDRDKELKDIFLKEFLLVYADVQNPKLEPPFSTPEKTPAFFVVEPNTMRLLSEPAIGAVPVNDLKRWLKVLSARYKKYRAKKLEQQNMLKSKKAR